jgi:opacity protein-like surface antigen
MKRILSILAVAIVAFSSADAQIYAKLNGLYALVGVVNPQVEAVIAPHSSLSVEATFSPWKSFNSRHLFFGMFSGEYRYYIKGAAKGFYGAFDAGMMGFDINKPYFLKHGNFINFNRNYGKGFGLFVGLGVGYHHHFNERWSLDAFIAFAYMRSWYNGYKPNGEIVMDPQGHEDYLYPDPFNGSSEIMPLKAGLSIGYALFNPKK